MKTLKLAGLTVAVLFSSTAMANVITDAGSTIVDGGKQVFKTFSNPGAVNAEIGTLGYGASIAWSANESTEVVAGWNGVDYDTNIDMQDSIINWGKVLGDSYKDYQGDLKLDVDFSNPYVGVNVRPWKNQFTVGTGVIFQDNTINASLVPANSGSTVKVKGTEYKVDGSLDLELESRNALAPYLTLGIKPNTNSASRVGFFGEVGAAYTGQWKSDVKVNATNITVVSGNGNATTPEKLAGELKEKLDKDTPTWYPIVKVGATFRF